MNKQEFLSLLKDGLTELPKTDIKERLNFYSEIIDDLIDEGLSEEEAVLQMGNPKEIATRIISETPVSKLAKEEKNKPKRRLNALRIVLIILGSPLWIPILIAVFAILLSVYIVLWSIIISFWAIFVSFICSAFGGIIYGTLVAVTNNTLTGVLLIGASLVLAGLSIFVFYGCKTATKGIFWLTKKPILSIKNRFITKERT